VWRAQALPRLVPAARARIGKATVDALAFRRDGLLAAGATDGSVYTWDVGAPRARPRLIGRGSDVRADPDKRLVYEVAFSPDGRTLASGGRDGTLRLWRVRDAAHATPIGAPDEMKARAAIRSLAFSPRGRVIAVGSGDGTVSLWNAVTRKELRETTPGVESVESVGFASGGQVLVTAGDDGTIRFWDVGASLLPLGLPLDGHAAKVRRLAVSRDASVLASAGEDGTVRLWPGIVWASADDLTARVCRLVAGGVTDAEWKTILRRVTAVAADEPRPEICPA